MATVNTMYQSRKFWRLTKDLNKYKLGGNDKIYLNNLFHKICWERYFFFFPLQNGETENKLTKIKMLVYKWLEIRSWAQNSLRSLVASSGIREIKLFSLKLYIKTWCISMSRFKPLEKTEVSQSRITAPTNSEWFLICWDHTCRYGPLQLQI